MVLANAEPKDISATLPKLLNCIRIIWAHSKRKNNNYENATYQAFYINNRLQYKGADD
jgi:hypothetical protein